MLILGYLLSMSLFDCLVGHDDLGSIDRKGKFISHWAMESNRSHDRSINILEVSKGKSNLANGSSRSCRWNEMDIKDFYNEK